MSLIKKGEWIIIITTKSETAVNISSKMKRLHGMILQIPENDNFNFQIIPNNGKWYWSSKQHHFIRATEEEIQSVQPNYGEPQYEIY